MKIQNTSMGMHVGTIRAGIISLLVLTLCYLAVTGLSDFPRVWLFIVSFAVCFVFMMHSIVDLLVLAFGFTAKFSGVTVGRAVRVARCVFLFARGRE